MREKTILTNMKSNITKKLIVAGVLLLLTCIMALNSVTAKAAEGEMKLKVKVKDSHNATITISGIDVPKEFEKSYEGFEDGQIPYKWTVMFGDYAVSLRYVPFMIQEYLADYGDQAITADALSVILEKITKTSENSYRSEDLKDCTVKLEAGKNSLTFEIMFSSKYEIDMSKNENYEVKILELRKSSSAAFKADKNGEVSEASTGQSDKANTGSTKTNISKATIGGIKNKAYTGKAITQALTVKNKDTELKLDKDYTISYKNNKSIGTATVVINGTGNYTGSVTKTFIINPKKVTLSSVKLTGDTDAMLTWKKDDTATGYLVYAAKGAGKYTKLTTISNNATLSYTAKALESGEKYSFKVRAYKKASEETYYGSYSKILTVTTKEKDNSKDTKAKELQVKYEVTDTRTVKITLMDPFLKDYYATNVDALGFIRRWYVRFYPEDGYGTEYLVSASIEKGDGTAGKMSPKDMVGDFCYFGYMAPERICIADFSIEGNNLIWEFTAPEDYNSNLDLSKVSSISALVHDGVDETKSYSKKFDVKEVVIKK